MSTTPRRLGQYELLHYLGRGNVGEVWKARDLAQHRDVAVKIFHSDLQSSEQHFLTRLTSEGQALVTLRHSNIVPVHEVKVSRPAQSQETTAYLAMDYIEGQTLADYLRTTSHKGIFPALPDIIYLFTSLGVAIDHAHQQGIVHGNIKPGNILLNAQDTGQFRAGEPLLTDFGLTRLAGLAGDNSTPFYISPEQAQGNAASNRSDIYALGVILYELCTGIVPFRDESSVAVMMQHIRTLPTPPNLINPNIPQALSEVILRAMAKDPISRFSMASLLAAAIADACSMQSPSYRNELLASFARENQRDESDESITPGTFLGVAQPQFRSQPLQPAARPLVNSTGPHNITGPTSLPGFKNLPSLTKSATPSRPLTSGPLTPDPLVGIPMEHTAVTPTPARLDSTSAEARLAPGPRVTSKIPVQMPAATTPPSVGTAPMPIAPYVPPPEPPAPITAQIPASALPLPPVASHARQLYNRAPGYVITASLFLIMMVLGSAIGITLLLNKGQGAATSTVPGQVFFQDDTQGQGRNSSLRITLNNVSAPPSGQVYFAWLEDTNGQMHALGAFPAAKNGSTTLSYPGDDHHTNLLTIVQGIFITTEDSGSQPAQPASHTVYSGTFDATMLTHIKDILYSTPGLPANQSAIISLLDAIRSINDKASSINDSLHNDNALVIRQAVRVIQILDGSSQASKSGDLPAKLPGELQVPYGLLSSANTPGYVDLLDQQLDDFKKVAGDNAMLLQHIQGMKNAITDLKDWLQNLRTSDVKLLKAADLQDPAITGVALQIKQAAADSFTGRTIPPNTSPQPTVGSAGAVQAYSEAQYLASLDLQSA